MGGMEEKEDVSPEFNAKTIVLSDDYAYGERSWGFVWAEQDDRGPSYREDQTARVLRGRKASPERSETLLGRLAG